MPAKAVQFAAHFPFFRADSAPFVQNALALWQKLEILIETAVSAAK